MRILAMLFLLTFFAVQGCTSDFPTAEDPGDAIVSETGQLAKSDNAAGVIRYEENVFHWAYDAGRNIEIDFFDPFLLCEAGLPAAFERAYIQDVVKETGGEFDRIHRREVSKGITMYVMQGFWTSCEHLQEMYDQGLIDVGTATFRLNDNDVIGTRERQNANAWTLRAHGNTTSISGVERKLNYHTHCSWTDPEAEVNCNWQVNYH